jgi:site-specific recombinase XerD
VLSPDEVARLIEASGNLQARAILMALYSTGMQRSELVHEDIDSERMVIHIRKGKGGKNRDVPMCPRLLEGEHLTDKAVWYACAEAARHAGLNKRVSPRSSSWSQFTRRHAEGHRSHKRSIADCATRVGPDRPGLSGLAIGATFTSKPPPTRQQPAYVT